MRLAVLTGDLRRSTRMSPSQIAAARAAVDAAVSDQSRATPDLRPTAVDWSRGDAWQLAIEDAPRAFRLALHIRARLVALSTDDRDENRVDSRIAVAIGGAEQFERAQVSLSTGDAFTRSGRALDAMSRKTMLAFAPGDPPSADDVWADALFALADAAVKGWSHRQAEHIALALTRPDATDETLAGLCDPPITKQTIGRSFARAAWPALAHAARAFEEIEESKTIRDYNKK